MHTFFLAPTHYGVGLTSVTLGLVRALDKLGLRVTLFKPIDQASYSKDDINNNQQLIEHITKQKAPSSISINEVEKALSNKKSDELMEKILAMHQQISKNSDVVVIEGLTPTRKINYASRVNHKIVQTLNADIILVSQASENSLKDEANKLEIAADAFGGINHPSVKGYILNKLDNNKIQQLIDEHGNFQTLIPFDRKPFLPLGYIPWDKSLSSPRTLDIKEYLNATIINKGEIATRRVTSYSLSARTPTNMINHIKPGRLIMTPGDRDDIILAVAVSALNGVPLAGLLLTSGLLPSKPIMNLCQKAFSTGLPILMTQYDSYTTASKIDRMDTDLQVNDLDRVEKVMETVSGYLKTSWFEQACLSIYERQLSPPAFRYSLVQRAISARKRIVLPEGNEPRTIKAAVICHNRSIAQCILLGDEITIQQTAHDNDIQLPNDLIIINPNQIQQSYIEPMVKLRQHKGLNEPMAKAQLEDPVVLGTMMLAQGDVDGLVSGAIHTTANTIRPAFQLIKPSKESGGLISSIFFMLLPDQVLVYGDCAVNPNPTAEQLAHIAIQSADSARLFGIEPRVAMISYATGVSGLGIDVDRVRAATQHVKKLRPDIIIDGPMQYDAAAVKSVAQSKAPDSTVAGRATVFIFPDLNTGNTTYKAVQRSANVISVGPMLQGLNRPVNDLSRGALIEDIVYTIALTTVQAETNSHST